MLPRYIWKKNYWTYVVSIWIAWGLNPDRGIKYQPAETPTGGESSDGLKVLFSRDSAISFSCTLRVCRKVVVSSLFKKILGIVALKSGVAFLSPTHLRMHSRVLRTRLVHWAFDKDSFLVVLLELATIALTFFWMRSINKFNPNAGYQVNSEFQKYIIKKYYLWYSSEARDSWHRLEHTERWTHSLPWMCSRQVPIENEFDGS